MSRLVVVPKAIKLPRSADHLGSFHRRFAASPRALQLPKPNVTRTRNPNDLRGLMVVSSISPRLRHLPSLPLFLPSINHRFFGTKSSQVLGDDAAGTLCRAAKQNDIAALKKLLEEGANVNAADYDKRTALHIAAAEGNLEIVKFLVEHGADVNAADRYGCTPLADAVRFSHDEIAQYLTSKGAKISSQDALSLCQAAAEGNLAMVKRLISSGVDPSVADYDQRTPLHLAASEGRVEVVKFLISKGANVNALDRFGGTPLQDAQRRNTKAHQEVIKVLEAHGAVREQDIKIIRHTAEFISSLQKSLPLLCDRGDWSYVEVLIESEDEKQFVPCAAYWFSAESPWSASLTRFRKTSETFAYEKTGDTFPSRVISEKRPMWIADLAGAPKGIVQPALQELCSERGVKSAMAVPVVYNDNTIATMVFYSMTPREENKTMMEDFASISVHLIFAGLPSVKAPPNSLPTQPQMLKVMKLIAEEGVFSPAVIYQEVDWWYNRLGLQQYYFDHYSPEQIAKHIHGFVAAKKISGDKENITFQMETPEGGFYICPLNRDAVAQVEQKLERFVQQLRLDKMKAEREKLEKEAKTPKERAEIISKMKSDVVPYNMTFFRSKGPAVPHGHTQLGLYISERTVFVQPDTSDTETDIWKLGTAVFLRDKPPAIRERYQMIVAKAVNTLAPVIEVFPAYRDGTIPLMFAYKRGPPRSVSDAPRSFLSLLTQLVEYNELVAERKFIETFSNGVVVHSLYVHPAPEHKISEIIEQASLLYHVASSPYLADLFLKRVFNSEEYAYAHVAGNFIYYFVNKRSEEFNLLAKALESDSLNRARLNLLQNTLRRDAVTHARIESCIGNYPEIIKALYADFERMHSPGSNAPREFNTELANHIRKTVGEELDSEILNFFVIFNSAVEKTNFYVKDKAALAFRLHTEFIKESFPAEPYGVFFVMGYEFRGFHVRFRDIARGGIRLIFSSGKQAYRRNLETLFGENYGLAYTQQKKNKDIPEGGSKGTILLASETADPAFCFKQYVDSIMDLLNLPHPQIKNHYKGEEILFLGPDEGTAGLMDWAANHARKRGYRYWKAFTTGKSPLLGGIPHDEYGMTTRSIHRYVLGCLNKLGLKEEDITKLQTGGPDGDLGSNEILISKDRTTSVVDGSGVVHDPDGLDRAELVRLARKRAMIEHYDPSKLGPNGFKVLVKDRDVRLPNGEVVESGLTFRNEFHLLPYSSADLFVPCGGRPEAVNIKNVKKMFKPDGVTPRFKIIVEGANLFLTQDARLELEKAGVILYKDASANKGGVTSSSLEVLACLAFSDREFEQHMQVKGGVVPDFYKTYVQEVQNRIEHNAQMEFECIWREHERTKIPRCILTDMLSDKINVLKDFIADELWKSSPELRTKVLYEAIPDTLIDRLGLDTIMERVPDMYLRAIFAAYIASNYIYRYGLASNELNFYHFMDRFNKISI